MSYKTYKLFKEWFRHHNAGGGVGAKGKTRVVITAGDKTARNYKTDLEFFSSARAVAQVCLFPAPDTLPYTHLTPQPDIWIDRLKILNKLHHKESVAVIAPIGAILRRCPPPWIFQRYERTIRQKELLDRDEFAAWLEQAGYINQVLVEEEGTFALRGSIIDVYPPTQDRPIRLELDGDEIVSIRSFDAATQRSSFSVPSFSLNPVRNIILNEDTKKLAIGRLKELADASDIKPAERRGMAEAIEHGFHLPYMETLLPIFYEKTASFADYLPESALVYLDDKEEVNAEAEKLISRLYDAHQKAAHIEKIIRPEELYDKSPFVSRDVTLVSLDGVQNAFPVSIAGAGTARRETKASLPSNHLAFVVSQIKNWQSSGLCVIITCHTTTQADRLLDLLKWQGLLAEITDRPFLEVITLARSIVHIMVGTLSSGFVSEDDGLAILTDEEIFGSKFSRRATVSAPIDAFSDFSELTEGSFVVHKDHGIGRFLGLKNLDVAGTKNDFLILEYLGGDKLYLPVWRVNLIGRYIGDGQAVAIDRLGGTRWTRLQNKVNSAIRTLALEILKIHAARETQTGFVFTQRDQILEEFEATFPYDETADQWQAIEDTLADMQRNKPADRLICGDVGYGKTEVAMRAAFKAAADGKQVAVLVPTTVLAFQHYENFASRFQGWPVRIEMLSRFRKKSEQRHIVEELGYGMVNIVIGTHRLLQRDIRFNDLGLLIIDEEHRFGVAHKERIKKLKNTVDTITMTATPIPRTLNMALSGLRGISVINTPPVDRLAIRTYVAEYDDTLIRSAIMAELARGGQVFFLHNKIETIERMFEHITKLVPEAHVVVGHGQMKEDQLEDVMIKFLRKEANVLLCTTIIESGLDIPSANTIIINRADTLGLAQLYQLRGRVGRSNIQAYAYLLIPNEETISTVAKKRLNALQKYTELGSGFKIAMHDLEIRGAGNILGAQQSGHINAIGYEIYVELLEKTIRRLKGEEEIVEIDVEISLSIPAYIPTDYIKDDCTRLIFYRRLSAIDSEEEIDKIASEITDRFGPMPNLVKNLLSVIEIRMTAKRLMIEFIQFDGRIFAFKFHSRTPVKPDIILKLVRNEPKKYAFKQPSTLLVREAVQGAEKIISAAKSILRLLQSS